MSNLITKSTVNVDKILDLIKASGKSENTIINYCTTIRKAGDNLGSESSLRHYLEGLEPSQQKMLKYAYNLVIKQTELELKRNALPEDVANIQAMLWRLEALKSSFRISKPKTKKLKVFLTSGEIVKMFETARHPRDKAILILCLGLGLRRDTAGNALWENLGLEGDIPMLYIPKDKGDKDHKIPLTLRMYQDLLEYKKICPDGEYILRTLDRGRSVTSNKLDGSNLYRTVVKLGKLAGIKKPVTPHSLRRSFAETLRQKNVDIVTISKALNHSSVEVTMIYLDYSVKDLEGLADLIPYV